MDFLSQGSLSLFGTPVKGQQVPKISISSHRRTYPVPTIHSSGRVLLTWRWDGEGVRAKSLQLCLILCDPVDGSLTGSSVHGILQARILEWVAMPSSRASSWPRDGVWVSCVSCTGRFFTTSTTWKGAEPNRRFAWGVMDGFSGATNPRKSTCMPYVHCTCVCVWQGFATCLWFSKVWEQLLSIPSKGLKPISIEGLPQASQFPCFFFFFFFTESLISLGLCHHPVE